jgi:hypothetical protein
MDWTCLQDVQIKNTKENLGLEAAGYVDGRGDELLKLIDIAGLKRLALDQKI